MLGARNIFDPSYYGTWVDDTVPVAIPSTAIVSVTVDGVVPGGGSALSYSSPHTFAIACVVPVVPPPVAPVVPQPPPPPAPTRTPSAAGACCSFPGGPIGPGASAAR